MKAELRMTERKLEMERINKATIATLPKLKITPFKGTSTDWVRFENMFDTQVDSKADLGRREVRLFVRNGSVQDKGKNFQLETRHPWV